MNSNIIEKFNEMATALEKQKKEKSNYIEHNINEMCTKYKNFKNTMDEYVRLYERLLKQKVVPASHAIEIPLTGIYSEAEISKFERGVQFTYVNASLKSLKVILTDKQVRFVLMDPAGSTKGTALISYNVCRGFFAIPYYAGKYYQCCAENKVISEIFHGCVGILSAIIYENMTRILQETEHYFATLLEDNKGLLQTQQENFENFKEVYEKLLKNAEMRNSLTDVISDLTPEQVLKIKIYIEANLQ